MGNERVEDCKIELKIKTNHNTYEKEFDLDSHYHDKGYRSIEEMVWDMIDWLIDNDFVDIDWFRE